MATSSYGNLIDDLVQQLTKSASADDGTRPATTGARAAENSADIKENVPANVDSAPDNGTVAGAGENEPTNRIGTNKDETGKNVPPTKPASDDPTNNKEASYADLTDTGNDILASLAIALKDAEKAASAPGIPAAPAVSAINPATETGKGVPPVAKTEGPEKGGLSATGEKTAAAPAEPKALSAEELGVVLEKAAAFDEMMGMIAANQVAGQIVNQGQPQTKQASAELEKQALAQLQSVQNAAIAHAADLADYLRGYGEAEKQAADAGLMDPTACPPGAMGGAPGAAGPMDPSAGGDPTAGGGDPEIEQLIQALMQAGMTPDQIQQLLTQAASGGDAGGAPAGPDVGGPPSPPPAPDKPAPSKPDKSDKPADDKPDDKGKDDAEKEAQARAEKVAVEKLAAAIVQLSKK